MLHNSAQRLQNLPLSWKPARKISPDQSSGKAAGFQPVMVVDAVASRREEDKKIAIERAIQEGILMTTAEAVLFELTLDSTNPCFKAISKLVK